jgi:formate dehydrogenase major subunit
MDILTRDNRLVRIEGDWNAKINGGVLCDVGRFHPMIEQRERVLSPMVRENGQLKTTTWEKSISSAAEIIQKRKGDFLGVASTRLSMEALCEFKSICDAYNATEVASTEQYPAVFDAFNVAKSKGKTFESKISDIKEADCYFLVGEDTTKDHQVLSFFAKRRKPFGAKLILITEGPTDLDNFSDASIAIASNDQAQFIASLGKLIIEKTAGVDEIAKLFKLESRLLANVIKIFASSKKIVIILGSRYESKNSIEVLNSLVSLNEQLKGNLITTKGNINSMGAALIGINKTVSDVNPGVVLMATGDEDLSQNLIKRLKKSSSSIIFSSYISPLTAKADIVFPVKNWLEDNGSFINLDGQVQESESTLEAPEGVLSGQESISKLAKALNIKKQDSWKEIVKKTPTPVAIKLT